MRDKLFTVRVYTAELEEIQRAAASLGVGMSEFARVTLMARILELEAGLPVPVQPASPTPALVVEKPEEVAAAVEELHRMASDVPRREFTPYSKERQAGRRPREKKG